MAGQINNVLNYFGRLDSIVKMRLLTTYCFSLYGSVLWDLSHSCIESVCGTWRRGVRRVWGLPNNAHSCLLPLLSGSLPINDELKKRFVAFANKCISSDSSLVRTVAKFAVVCGKMNSVFGRNVVSCCSRFNIALDEFSLLNREFMYNFAIGSVSRDVRDTASSLFELLCVRDGLFVLDYWTLANVNEFIRLLSTA